MSKKMKIKYAVCIPLMIFAVIMEWLSSKTIVPEFWTIVAILIVGVCIVVLQSEMTFFAPRKKK